VFVNTHTHTHTHTYIYIYIFMYIHGVIVIGIDFRDHYTIILHYRFMLYDKYLILAVYFDLQLNTPW